MSEKRYIFGPVPSRRLGRSLGVDLVPLKTCSYDCLYCQLGRTTCKTVERAEWVPLDTVVEQVRAGLDAQPDYITLSGSGEPTLYSRVAELIARIHGMTAIPVAVLTNGSLLWRMDVRSDIVKADLVIPSLDAGDATLFHAVNRPHASLDFERMIEGLIAFRQEYRGTCWLEIVLIGGYTALASEVDKLATLAARIKPDRVQLNTVTRPPAEEYATAVTRARLCQLAGRFDPPAEVIADFENARHSAALSAGSADILALLIRRPCTARDIAAGLSIHLNEVVKYLESGMAQGMLARRRINGEAYYQPAVTQPCSARHSTDGALNCTS